jgi:alkylation response protein AidB-like acyl-CoA dehydrogenase
MTHYRASRRDIEFTLFDVLGAHENWATDGPAEMSRETASEILRGAEQWAVEQFASSYEAGDDQPPTYDPATGEVRLAKSVRETIQQQLASEWIALDLPAELSDTPVPPSLRWAAAEFAMGANPAVSMCTNVTPVTATVLAKWGTADQRNLAKLMLERGWTSTMAITEDDAGSDVGAIRTKAVEREDGSWSITGTKRFITFGDHDAADNIIHLVLARPQLTDEAPKSGTRGLALFVVPKFRYEADGTIGDHNGIRVTGLAHKMGLKASPTCELSFGDTTETIGWALGGSTGGMQQIFDVIRNVRMLVGVKSVAALSSGYLVAHEYAVTRVQGNRLGRAGGPKVAIIEHPEGDRGGLARLGPLHGAHRRPPRGRRG